jgi:hypothetical protein
MPKLSMVLIFPKVGRDPATAGARRVCDVVMPIDRFTRRLIPTPQRQNVARIVCSLCGLQLRNLELLRVQRGIMNRLLIS